MRDIMQIINEASKNSFINSKGEEVTIRPIVSEELEPMAARVTGYLYARCEAAKQANDGTLMGACKTFWYGAMALEYLAVALTSARSYSDPSGIHFSIATSNNLSRVGKLIEHYVGINPMDDPTNWNP